jgi:hypothetical protein
MWHYLPAISFTVIVIALFLAAHFGASWLDRPEPPMTPLERAILEQLSNQPR